MIVILCEDFEQACMAFRIFLDFLSGNEPWHTVKIFEHSNMVETDDNLRYIFVDYKYEYAFPKKSDITDIYDFLNGIDEFYYSRQGRSMYSLLEERRCKYNDSTL